MIKNSNFKVGTTVKAYCPYGSFSYEAQVTEITKVGNVKIGSTLYYVQNDNYAVTRQGRYGQGSITIK